MVYKRIKYVASGNLCGADEGDVIDSFLIKSTVGRHGTIGLVLHYLPDAMEAPVIEFCFLNEDDNTWRSVDEEIFVNLDDDLDDENFGIEYGVGPLGVIDDEEAK